jgi:beta-glucosidase
VATNMQTAISLLAGIKEVAGKSTKVLYAKGSNIDYDETFETNATMFGKTLHRDSRSKEEMLAEALKVANQADVIVASLGESAEMSGESSSRTKLEIPQAQKDLLNELLKTGKPVVLVLFDGRPLILNDENAKVPAILNAWFAGSEAGYAIADVLFGDVNPSGKLTTTFPRSVGQLPIYYAHKNTGRPLTNTEGKFQKFTSNYLDERNEPLFPFGYGLSYTNFEYSNLKISSDKMNFNGKLNVSITVANTGNYDGKEIVQLYIKDVVGSVTRPVRELKGFQKIALKKGEKQTVTFEISIEDLKFYNSDLQFVAEPGQFEIFVGGNSNADNKVSFNLIN